MKFKKTLKALLRLAIKLSIIATIVFILLHFFVTIRICHSNDMYPNIKDGDLVVYYNRNNFINNLIYKDTLHYSFDDVVLYEYEGKEYIGRIVAFAGDTVEVNEYGLLVNGSGIYNSLPYTTLPQADLDYPIKLGENEFFILGDLRDQVKDSRTYGVIRKDAIIGKEVFLIRRRSF